MSKNDQLLALFAHPEARFWRLDLDQLTEPERTFRVVWDLEADVNNGGFYQYFSNPSGNTACLAPAALLAIGATNTAAIVREANAVFPGGAPPCDHLTRWAQLETLAQSDLEELAALNDRFIAYPDDLTELLHTYVATHAAGIPGAEDALRWCDPLLDDHHITSRTCPHCAAPCPRYRKTCKHCGKHVGRAE